MIVARERVYLDRNTRIRHLFILVAMLGVVGFGLWFHPNPRGLGTHRQLGFPPCTTYFYTGRPCPSCGMTTSVSACLHANFSLAWRANPFGIVFLLTVAGLGLNSLIVLLTGYGITLPVRLSAWLLGLLMICWLLYGILRFALTPSAPVNQRLTFLDRSGWAIHRTDQERSWSF